MRTLIVVFALSLGGCSYFNSMTSSSGAGTAYDPSKIYLGYAPVVIDADLADHYRCAAGLLVCERFGSRMQCRCTY
jgi:hypothetical protein